MPTFSSPELLQDLQQQVADGISFVETAASRSVTDWQQRPADGGWSAVEVISHLNFYADFYTQAISKVLHKAPQRAAISYRSGWFGDYFTRIIGPAPAGEALKTKMQAPKNGRPKPLADLDPEREIATYLTHQQTLQLLLRQAEQVHLGRHRVPTSLTPLIRLKLGDTFRFVIAHQQRHFQQITRVLETASTVSV